MNTPLSLLFALALLFASCTAAAATPASGKPHDPMGERLAPCAACHGDYGRSDDEAYYPSIAGKPAGYLYQQLLNFRDGRRHHAVMERMFAFMADGYLLAIADYYAAQQPKIAAPVSSASSETLAAGQHIVESGDPARDIPACPACHGKLLTGMQPAIPGVVGLPATYLAAQLGAWRSGVRKAREPDCMGDIARKLSEAELSAAVAWISSLPTSGDHRPAEKRDGPLPAQCGGVP